LQPPEPSGVATWTLGDALDVNGDLSVAASSGLDVSASNFGVTVAGNWSNSGTFTQRSGSVTLNGTAQTISGSDTFYNLVANTNGRRADLHGRHDADRSPTAATFQNVTLQGSSTGGWTLAMPATQTIDHVTVSASHGDGQHGRRRCRQHGRRQQQRLDVPRRPRGGRQSRAPGSRLTEIGQV
jgi:hypothetical protein